MLVLGKMAVTLPCVFITTIKSGDELTLAQFGRKLGMRILFEHVIHSPKIGTVVVPS